MTVTITVTVTTTVTVAVTVAVTLTATATDTVTVTVRCYCYRCGAKLIIDMILYPNETVKLRFVGQTQLQVSSLVV